MSSYNNIPHEMRAFRSWIVWRYETNPDDPQGKPRKIPYNPMTGRKASVTDPTSWTTFENAIKHLNFPCRIVCDPESDPQLTGYSGLGFVLSAADPYAFIDLDDSDNDPTTVARQQHIYSAFDSYSEMSPGGNGLHVIVKGSVEKGRRRAFIEVYSSERYMTMTGNVYRDAPIQERQELLKNLWDDLQGSVSLEVYDGNTPESETDEAIIERAKEAQNGDKFTALWEGDWSQYYGKAHGQDGTGHSEADLALMNILAFYTQNRAQLRRLFLRSQLGKREKATKHRTYIDKWLINPSFDRLLPPVDIEGLGNQLQLELDRDAKKKGATEAAPSLPGGNAETAQDFLPGMNVEVKPMHLNNLPPGLLGEIAMFIYSSSVRPVPEVALASAIGFMAGITGRAYNVSGTGLNQYVLLLAPTGTGKETLSSGITRIMNMVTKIVPAAAEFIGPSTMASGQGLIKAFSKSQGKCFVSVVGEVGLMLAQMTGDRASPAQIQLRKVILDLYNKSGAHDVIQASVYADSDKNVGSISNPAFSLLGETAPENFYKYLDESMIAEGFLPRFTIIEYNGLRPDRNKGHNLIGVPLRLVDAVSSLATNCLSLQHATKVIDVKLSDAAEEFSDSFDKFATHQINGAKDEVVRHLWNRAHMKLLKLSALIAVGVNPFDPVIDIAHMKWAHSLIVQDITRLLSKFERGEVGVDNYEAEQLRQCKKAIVDYLIRSSEDLKSYQINVPMHTSKIVSVGYIQKRLTSSASFRKDRMGATFAIKRCLQALVDGDVLREVGPKELREKFSTTQKAFAVSDFHRLKE